MKYNVPMNRKVKGRDQLPPAEGECDMRVACFIGQVQNLVEGLGDPQGFDAAVWMSRWLNDPLPALGGMRPLDLLDTTEGLALVSNTLAQIQSGAYA